MTRLVIDPAEYHGASASIGGDLAGGLAWVHRRLVGDLAGTGQMSGGDPTGVAWAAAYQPAANATAEGIAWLHAAAITLATLLQHTGLNHSRAEESSGGALPATVDRARYAVSPDVVPSCADVPLAAGGSGATPDGWSLLASAVGQQWPDGRQDRLRAAAAAWATAADQLETLSQYVAVAVDCLRGVQAPEAVDAMGVCTSMSSHVETLTGCCRSLAAGCTELASAIDQMHGDAHDILVEALASSTVIEVGGGLLSIVSLGFSEVAAQVLVGAEAASLGAEMARLFFALRSRAETIAAPMGGVMDQAMQVEVLLRPLLSATLTSADVTHVPQTSHS